MTQRMTPRGFENTGFGPSFLKSPLQDGFMEMMPALFTGVSVREMAHRRKDPLPAPFVPNGALLFKTSRPFKSFKPLSRSSWDPRSFSSRRNLLRIIAARQRHFVPSPAVEPSACYLFSGPAPLLEEKGNALGDAPISNLSNPPSIHIPRSRAGFPAHDHPVNTLKRQSRDWS